MRIERWYWLGVFCLVSLLIHIGLASRSRSFMLRMPTPPVKEIEIALEPLPEPKLQRKPEPKAIPKPEKPQIGPKRAMVTPQEKRVLKKAQAQVADKPVPVMPSNPRAVRSDEPRPVTPKATAPGGMDPLKDEKPLPLGLPSSPHNTDAPRMVRIARADLVPGGGGSPAPSRIPGARGGAAGAEAPPDELIYNGGGAGGANLPKAAPRMGGGGGRSILSVENPLAKDAIPEERPGLGPGIGGGEGAGSGAGIGYARGRGVGARPDAGPALAALRVKPGIGIGAGSGAGVGTRAPGGGRGVSAELPGTGGEGIGYGRGAGIGMGHGRGIGIGDGSGGRNGDRVSRGIPFGDITGMLREGLPTGGGGVGGGPGGPGRGSASGYLPSGKGGKGRIHMVYALDSSGSMRDGDKIGKAKEALKKALLELKPTDSFSIVNFDKDVHVFADMLLPASRENVDRACAFVDGIQLRDFTNMSGALETALSMRGVTHVFLLSDGEPHGGIENPDQLRQMVRDKNSQHVLVYTLALGLGEQFKGMALLKGLADDNEGKFSYVNLSK